MPNIFAYVVLFTWPLVVVILFRSLPLRSALVWSIVAGFLLLPLRAGFDLPGVPAVDKNMILSCSAAILCLLTARAQSLSHGRNNAMAVPQSNASPAFQVRRGQPLFLGLLALLFTTPFVTAVQNGKPVIIGETFLPGLKLYDGLSAGITLLITITPFLLGRRYLASEDSQRVIMRTLILAALAYSLLILYEVRMSPQLNMMLYGFFPHSWAQHVRGGGYRPLVFLNHGLWLAIFIATAFLSSLALWRADKGAATRARWLLAAVLLLGILMLCRSLGAQVLGLIFFPLILLVSRQMQLRIAAVTAAIVLIYPAMRGANLIPVNSIYEVATSISQERAKSLKGRLDNEDRLLKRAQEKPIAGWGGWGRSRVFDENGKDISVTDGYWVILIGVYGWLGYIAQFGLLTLPIIFLNLRQRQFDLSLTTSGLALVFSVSLIDLIPNATIGPLTWLVAGSMMGRFQTASRRSEREAETKAQAQTAGTPETETDAGPKVLYRRPLGKNHTTRQN